MYWHQGWDLAPKLANISKMSFISLNPDYEIVLLDQNNISDYIDIPKCIETNNDNIDIKKISNLYRLALLCKYGGIWSDASVICRRPLNSWVNEYDTNFFTFRNPGKDRLISTWFIVVDKDSLILQRWNKEYSELWAENHFSNQKRFYHKFLIKIFSLWWNNSYKTTPRWLSWFARKILRVYPYYICHYTFNKLIINDYECSKLWYGSKAFNWNSYNFKSLRELKKDADGIDKAKREIDSWSYPVFKFSFNVDYENKYWDAVLAYLQGKL